jgi:4-hydroxybutyrate CoA-transferase
VVLSGCGAAPLDFLGALAARSDLREIFISHATAWGELPHLREASRRPKHLRYQAYFLPATARKLHARREVDYLPLTFSQMSAMYERGSLQTDVVAVTSSPPDEDGYCSLGPFVSYLPAALRSARVRIAECSPTWPRTGDAARVHVSQFDCLVEVNRQPVASAATPDDQVSAEIAKHVLELVPDRATIQIGRGAIPNAVAAGLRGRRDLGIHSEMVSDWVVDLWEDGVITGSYKTSQKGRIVTAFMDGTERLYRFADANPALCMLPIYEVNDPAAVRAERNFIAINSAVEVDITGQINAESVQGELISGSGGLLDFAVGAGLSPGGKFIIAMSSTARNGQVSRIVESFTAGTSVTVPRSLAQFVITEYGIADLRGCSLGERAKRLIAIAHPNFREELMQQIRSTLV